MKKLLQITALCLLFAACSKNTEPESNIIYDETKGYLTNIESVRYGIAGTWKAGGYLNELECDAHQTFKFTKDNKYTYEQGGNCPLIENKIITGQYIIFENNGKFYIELDENFAVIIYDPAFRRSEISILSKTNFYIPYIAGGAYTRQ